MFSKNTIYHKNTHGNWTLSLVVHECAINFISENVIRKLDQVSPSVSRTYRRGCSCVVCVWCKCEYVMCVMYMYTVHSLRKTFLCKRCKISWVYLPTAQSFFVATQWWGLAFECNLLLFYATYAAVKIKLHNLAQNIKSNFLNRVYTK